MSDPRYRDPRVDDSAADADLRRRRVEANSTSDAMWGWIAGGVLFLLIVVFVFAGGRNVEKSGPPPLISLGECTATEPEPGLTLLKDCSSSNRMAYIFKKR